MITIDELSTELSNIGVTVSDTMLQCIVDTVNNTEQCLIDKGLSECLIKLSQTLAALLLCSNLSASKVIQSESVDVIRIAYKVESASVQQQGWYNQLVSLGGFDCFADIIAPPVDSHYGFMFSGGSCS